MPEISATAIGKRVRFSNGIFETNDSDLQRFVESNEWFGIYIERIDLVGQMTEPNLRTPERLGIDFSCFTGRQTGEQPEGRPLGTIGL